MLVVVVMPGGGLPRHCHAGQACLAIARRRRGHRRLPTNPMGIRLPASTSAVAPTEPFFVVVMASWWWHVGPGVFDGTILIFHVITTTTITKDYYCYYYITTSTTNPCTLGIIFRGSWNSSCLVQVCY
jgi:hypothetical protein